MLNVNHPTYSFFDYYLYRLVFGNCDSLNGIDLKNANLAGLDLRNVNFSYSNLEGTDFAGSDLGESKFIKANLQRANFAGADFIRGAYHSYTRNTYNIYTMFDEANLQQADFSRIKVQDSGRRHCISFKNSNLRDSKISYLNIDYQENYPYARDVCMHFGGANLEGAKIRKD